MSSITKKVLFIVEGQLAEKNITINIAKKIFKLADDSYEICTYGTCIYELYDEIKDDSYIYTVDKLIEKGVITIPNGETSKSYFSQIYLFFDYEPNYQKYSDAIISNLLSKFNNETEEGKLYINYPMVEAIFYLDDFINPSSLPKTKELYECFGDTFKKETRKITCYKNNNNIDFTLQNTIHIWNAIKWNYLIYCMICKRNVEDFNQVINYNLLLEIQINMKNNEKKIFVIGTLILLIVDYNPKILKIISNNI